MKINTGRFGITFFISRTAASPFISGMKTSITTRSGRCSSAFRTASSPFSASAQISMSRSNSSVILICRRINSLSSATRMRFGITATHAWGTSKLRDFLVGRRLETFGAVCSMAGYFGYGIYVNRPEDPGSSTAEGPCQRVVQAACYRVKACSHTVNRLLTARVGCSQPKYLNCVDSWRDFLVSRCANPSCEAQFKYLHEGRLFHFAAAGTPTGISKSRLNFAFWWLCPRCCSSMTLIQNGPAGAKLVLLSLPKVRFVSVQNKWEVPLE